MRRFVGYTLIEILIVLFIISIVTSVTLLNINDNPTRIIEHFTEDFLSQLSLAEEQALLTPCVIGVFINHKNISFKRLDAVAGKLKWHALNGNLSHPSIIPSNIYLLGSAKQKAPQIIISSDGEVSAFNLPIAYKNQTPQFEITGEAGGNVYQQSLKQVQSVGTDIN